MLYHCTLKSNVKKIIKEGILMKKPSILDKLKGVYLSKRQFNWMHWCTHMGTWKGAQFTIDASELKMEPEIHKKGELLREMNVMNSGHWDADNDLICNEDISPFRIIEIHIEEELKPGTFYQVKREGDGSFKTGILEGN